MKDFGFFIFDRIYVEEKYSGCEITNNILSRLEIKNKIDILMNLLD